jgi:hypothetical protein
MLQKKNLAARGLELRPSGFRLRSPSYDGTRRLHTQGWALPPAAEVYPSRRAAGFIDSYYKNRLADENHEDSKHQNNLMLEIWDFIVL